MTTQTQNYELLTELPIQRAPVAYFQFQTLVPHLLDLHEDWTSDDIRDFVEEKTRRPCHPEDLITLRAIYLHCRRLRREFDGMEM